MTGRAASSGTLAALAALDTSAVSDALDRLGIVGQPHGIRPLDHESRICGHAFTVRYRPIDPTRPDTVGDFIDDVDSGSVVVIDNGGRLDATVWGDLMTTVAARNGVAGTVIHGVSRDTRRALELEYPIFVRSTFMRTGKDRVQLESVGDRVDLGGVGVDLHDVIVGDSDGIVVIPRDRADDVLEVALEIEAAEESIRALLADGERLDAARQRHGYHGLQARSG